MAVALVFNVFLVGVDWGISFLREIGLGMSELPLLGGVSSLTGVLLLTPVVLRLARQRGWVAEPSADRWHDEPVALLGGIAIFGAFVVALVGSGAITAYTWPVWLGGLLIFGAGLADDLVEMRPEAKFVVQIAAAALLIYAGHAFWRGGPFWISIPLTFLWVIGLINAVNLIDGIDGLAASITAVAATALALIGIMIGEIGLATVAALLAGAGLGFLAFNANPARIFMGDCGSLFLGYMLAVVALDVQNTGEPIAATLIPIVVFAVPIFDTTFVTVTRILNGRDVTEGGNDHTHHRLIRLGLSENGAVLALSGWSAMFAAAALTLPWTTAQLALALVLIGIVTSVVFGLYLVRSRSYKSDGADAADLPERLGAFMQAVAGGVYWKSVGGVVADLLVVFAAFVVAIHLRFGGAPPPDQMALMDTALPGIVMLKVVVFYIFGLYHGVWRHAGTPEIIRLIKASTLASLLTLGGLVMIYGLEAISISAAILDWMIATGGIGGIRFAFRVLRQYFAARRVGGRNVLVYGSGDQGLLAVRHLRHYDDRTVVGLLDNDPNRHALTVQGIEVLGGCDDLRRLATEYDIDELIVPSESPPQSRLNQLARTCRDVGIDCRHFAFALEPVSPPPAPVRNGIPKTVSKP